MKNIPIIANLAEITTKIRQTMTNHNILGNSYSPVEISSNRFMESSPIGIFILDTKGLIRYCNPASYEHVSYVKEDFLGKHFLEVISEHGGDKARFKNIFKSITNGKPPAPFEFMYKRKDGTLGYSEFHISLINEDDAKLGILVNIIDTTERKRWEQELQEERDKARMYLDIAGVILLVIDPNQIVTQINKKGCEALGYREDEIVGKNWFDNFIPPRVCADVRDVFQQFMSGKIEPIEYYENPILTKTGEEKIIAWHNAALRDEGGNITGTLSSGEDISRRRQAEEHTKLYRLMLMSAQDAIFCKDLESRYIVANDKALEAFDLPREKVIGKNDYELMPDEHEAGENVRDDRLVFTTGEVKTITKHMTDAHGTERWFEAIKSPRFDNKGNIAGLIGVARDITERKQMETALRESEANFRNSLDNSLLSIRIFTDDGKQLYCNQATLDLWGYNTAEELSAVPLEILYTPESYADFLEGEKKRLRGEPVPEYFERAIVCKDGSVRCVEVFYKEMLWNGAKCNQIFRRDVTGRKQAETALRESEANFRTSMDNSPLGISIFSKDGKQYYCNQSTLDLWGYRTAEELEAVPMSKRYTPESHAEYLMAKEKQHRGEPVPNQFKRGIVRSDGSVHFVEMFRKEILWNGEKCNQLTYHDITERKQMEEEIIRKTALLEAQSEASIDGILAVDSNNQKILVNRHFQTMWNIPDKIAKNEDDEETLKHVTKQLKDPAAFLQRVEYLYAHEDEKSKDELELADGRTFDRYSAPLMGQGGKHYGRIWYFRDITERKKIEAQMFRLSSAISLSSDYIVVTDFDAKIIDVNSKTVEMYGADSKEELIGKHFLELVSPARRAMVSMDVKELVDKGYLESREYHMVSKNGREIPMQMSSSLVKAADGKPLGMVRVGRELNEIH